MLQGRVSVSLPSQLLPPFAASISMFLVRICSPCPQVTEQVLQFPNKLHVQLTKFMVKSNFWGIYNTLNNAVVVTKNELTNRLAKTIYAVLAASITSLTLPSAITITVIDIAIWCC